MAVRLLLEAVLISTESGPGLVSMSPQSSSKDNDHSIILAMNISRMML